jgi:uncharacterized membrane-anchored protein
VIAIPQSDVTLNVPTSFLFYPADAARAHLTRIGAPAPGDDILGLLAPADKTPGQDDFWGAVVTYRALGRVDAGTATGLDEQGFVQTVRQARGASQRSFEAFETAPAFTAATNTLSWIEQTARPQPTATAFRAESRILGRRGVAGLTIPARENQLSQVKATLPSMLGMIGFNPGSAYADYNAQIDTASAYTVPGLVTNLPESGAVAEIAGAGGPGQTAQAKSGGPGGTNYLPWLVGGAAVVGVLAWLALANRRRPDDEDLAEDDPNISPRED